jgi:hypothetical protein
MKKILTIITFAFCACTEQIDPLPNNAASNVLEVSANQYTEVKIEGFGSVWVNGKQSELILVKPGVVRYSACGKSGTFIHDGKTKLTIECQ